MMNSRVSARGRRTPGNVPVCYLALTLLGAWGPSAQAEWTNTGPFGGRVSAVAVDPVDSRNVYAGTPGGVFRSTDSGAGWSLRGLGLGPRSVMSLAIDPSSRAVYAAAEIGLFRSMDLGQTWKELAPQAHDVIAIDPSTRSTLYAIRYSGVFRSTDSGETWTRLAATLFDYGVSCVVVDPAVPTRLFVAAGGKAYRSTDWGASFSVVGPGLPASHVVWIAIGPGTPPTLYGSLRGAGVYKSTDAGDSWVRASNGLTDLSVSRLVVHTPTSTVYAVTDSLVFRTTDGGGSWNPLPGLHSAGVVDLAVDPGSASTLFAGTSESGVSRSTDSGGTWTIQNQRLSSIGIAALTLDPTSPTTLWAVGSKLFRSSDSGATWQPVGASPPSSPGSLIIDARTPGTLYAGTQAGVYKSTDSGATWTAARKGMGPALVTGLVADPRSPSTLLAGVAESSSLLRTTDAAASWAEVGQDLESYGVSALAFDSVDPTRLYASRGILWSQSNAVLLPPGLRADGLSPYRGVYRSRDSGSSWAVSDPGILTPFFLSALLVDRSDSSRVIAGGDEGLARSTDGGLTWTRPAWPFAGDVASLSQDPARIGTFYACGPEGLYRSADSGATWASVSAGLPHAPLGAVVVDSASSLFVSVGSAGVWRSSPPVLRDGDVNGDGALDVFDLVVLANHLVGNVAVGEAPFVASGEIGDVDRDGVLQVLDMVTVASWIVNG